MILEDCNYGFSYVNTLSLPKCGFDQVCQRLPKALLLLKASISILTGNYIVTVEFLASFLISGFRRWTRRYEPQLLFLFGRIEKFAIPHRAGKLETRKAVVYSTSQLIIGEREYDYHEFHLALLVMAK